MKKNLFLGAFGKDKVEKQKKKTLLSSLAPKVLAKEEDIEKIQPYLDKLNEAIDTEGISNIALTGGYGSGKSTVIKTFKSLNKQYEYLNISLASFNKKKEDENENNTQTDVKVQKEELERLLEVSILQQIFYHVKPQQIPESRFKRIDNISGWRIFGISISFVLWVVCITLLLKYNYLDKINPTTWKAKNSIDWWSLLIFLISFSGLGVLSKLVINLFSNSKINKVNIKGELELGDNVNKSVFNEHLEEILYFFERTKYNVVIIEDLDRFDSTDIFTKLREINILLNNSLLIDREINFVYAVGDDLFNDRKERVKFFEYIIPVIPFINSSNADEQLNLLIKESGLHENIFTREFTSDITTFIDDIDMRLLTNIFQEFVIYRKTLKPEFIKKNDELFAMITYKNLYPTDFTELNRNEGKLYNLINNKKLYIKNFINKVDKDILDKNTEIGNIESETIDDIEELKSIYFQKILSKIPTNALINRTTINDDFEEIISKQKLSYKYHNRGYSDLFDNEFDFKFSEIENEINPEFTYEERAEFIELKKEDKVNSLKNEINKLKTKKLEIQNWDLKQIFNEVDINQYLDGFTDVKLLRSLILEGYINENYNDYISLFYEGSLTKDDKKFEQNVKSRFNSDFNYKLVNIDNLLKYKHLSELKYFERDAILNFDLLDYLGENYNNYPLKYDLIIKLLSNGKERSMQFIDGYINNEERRLEIFFEKLVGSWKDFWEYIVEKSNYDRTKIDEYLRLMIVYTKPETILNIQSKKFLNEMIGSNPEFLSLVKNEAEKNYYVKITTLLKGLNTKFEKLNNPDENTEKLFEYVYDNNHYIINSDNLLQQVLLFGKDVDEEDFKSSNYSTILKSDCKPLIEYINSDLSTYIEKVYLKLEDNKLDNEESLLKLLNNKNIDNKLKVRIIQKVETKISDINKINDLEVKTQLFLNNKIIPKWSNVTSYYTDSEDKIDENLVEFLNFENVYTDLSKEKMIHKSDTFEYSVFRENLLLTNELSNESYTKILESSIYYRDKLAFENLDKDKVDYLTQRILNTTKTNYDLLKEGFKNNHIKLLEKNFKTFLDKNTEFETEDIDILLLLNSDKITIDKKFDYIIILDESTVSSSKEISKKVGEIILQKSTIVEFNIDTLKSIIINQPTAEKRILLINLYFEKLTNDDIIKLLSSIGNYDNLFKNKKPTFNKTEYNRILLERLKSKGLIKNYYDNKWNDEEFRVTTNY